MSAPIRAAMVRFSSLDASLWPRAVRSLAALGFNAIDVPLVWREHEVTAGRFDLESRSHDVAAFLDVIAREGLRAVVRLGPWPTTDVESLGIPDRVLRDRACQARTRRQNPVYVLDLPGLSALPSVASAAYRREAAAWVTAAARAIAPRVSDGTVVRVVVGHGPPATLRDDAFEIDHHPDARGDDAQVSPPHHPPLEAGVAEVARQTRHAREFLLALAEAARAEGVPAERVALAVTGSALVSPLAMELGREHTLVLAAAPPRAGVSGIWRQVRFARSFAVTAHLDLRAGNPPFEPPTRATHTLQAARVALAAGARDITVQMGCAGDGWIGALLDERGDQRPHAARWGAMLEWAASLPDGRETGAVIAVRPQEAAEVRAATGVHPLPLGLLAWVGFAPEELAAKGAIAERHDAEVERSLTERGVPHRRALIDGDGAESYQGGDVEPFVEREAERWKALSARVLPPGAALVRAVEEEGATVLVIASTVERPIRVAPPADGVWCDEAGRVDEARALPGGEVAVFREVKR